MAKSRKTFCWSCWRDWKNEFLHLSPWEQEQFIDKNPRINPNDYERGRCPFCGAQYDQDVDGWFDLIFEDESDGEYQRADWEDEP